MKLNRILCPIDFSDFSKAANFYASLFAQEADAQLVFLSVLYPPGKDDPIESQLDDLYSKLSSETRPVAPDVRHKFEVLAGDPASAILSYANENHVDLIVMGTHGVSGLGRLFHGSVCQKVLRHAICPVMAVKDTVDVDWISPFRKEALP
ncbi:universal stress protein [Mariniblastus fucicola]|uniref:Stress response protein NhaX n=1 Tax=Mariniblastus fucicola TaxID=980251 RepID=A0A5B9PBB4_9BACT|nr:universal stress protein [Mariniblastus fucicola]QEG20411.1 Stress response protein NhaX [Mariniblastus fucicola]